MQFGDFYVKHIFNNINFDERLVEFHYTAYILETGEMFDILVALLRDVRYKV